MSMRWKHWCHNGCGKKVVFLGVCSKHFNLDRYKCEKCGRTYEDKEALDWKNKA